MIGKTLYKAKVKDDKIVIESNTIVKMGTKLYYFDEVGVWGCLKSDVGVVCWLSEQEAIAFLVGKLEASIEMGENYIKREKKHLKDAIAMLS